MKGSVKYKHSESHHQDLTADTTGLKHSESYHQDLTAYTTGLKHSESHHQDLTAYTTGLKHSESHHQDLTADTTGLKRVGVLCQGLQYGQKQRVCGQVLKEQRYPCRKGRICNTRCSLTRRGHRLSCITMHHFCSLRGNSNVKVQGSVCNTTGMQCVCVCVCVCECVCACMTNLDKICFQLCGKLGILAEMKDASHCNFFLQQHYSLSKTKIHIIKHLLTFG